MEHGQLIVVALGGNAISLPDEEGRVDQQFANSQKTACQLADLVQQGYRLVITHGNGPQIGNFLLRNYAASKIIYPLPMEVASAHVQGGMGYMIGQTLMNDLRQRGTERTVTTMITTVVVDHDDLSFRNPTKPIGRVMTSEDARQYAEKEGWPMKEVAPGKVRRLVASPRPQRILEIDNIRRLVDAGEIVVACGGGGIPVIQDSDMVYHGTNAVIDKDLASAILATDLKADAMAVLTNIERVCINFGKPDQKEIERMTVSEAQAWFDEGQFPPGTMGPKIEGALNFLKAAQKPDARVVIGPLFKAADTVAGKAGTTITKN
jgi:carbamate kinase